MNNIKSVVESPIGKIGIAMEDGFVTSIKLMPEDARLVSSPLTKTIENELQAYFSNPLHTVNLPFKTNGSPFQETVWQALRSIPSGKTMTYGQLAKQLQTSPRAIGQACRTNPLLIMTPCHRVVSSHGLGGFAGEINGDPVSAKKSLLHHESAH